MTLAQLLQMMTSHQRTRTHFSREFVYCAGKMIWELRIETLEDQAPIIKKNLKSLLAINRNGQGMFVKELN